jgi:hypothetical protein
MSESVERQPRLAGRLLEQWKQLGEPLRLNRRARSLDWSSAQHMIGAAEPLLLANSHRLKILLEKSNEALRPLADPLLTDYGVHEWLSRSREKAYSDWLAWVLRQIKEPRDVLRLLDIDDLAVEPVLRGVPLAPAREVFAAEGHPGHTGKMDLQMVVPGKVLIQVELKLTSADASDVEKGGGYSASAKTYGVPECHRHRRLLATNGNESCYPGGYRLLAWGHVAIQLRIIAVRMVHQDGGLLAASGLLGFVAAIEQNLLKFSSFTAESAFRGKRIPSSTGLIEHLKYWLNGKD